MSSFLSGRASLSLLVLIAGTLLFVVAAIWWWLVFRQVMANDYLDLRSSLACAGASSTTCDLAMSLCKTDHPLGLRWYSPILLWSGAFLVSLSLVFPGRLGPTD